MPDTLTFTPLADMTDTALDAALVQLAAEHASTTPGRRQIIGTIIDRVLDEMLSR